MTKPRIVDGPSKISGNAPVLSLFYYIIGLDRCASFERTRRESYVVFRIRMSDATNPLKNLRNLLRMISFLFSSNSSTPFGVHVDVSQTTLDGTLRR